MRFDKLSATFGRLRNDKLDLTPGLNVIEAPNEHGKTTWCSFISAMLYGIDTSERDRNGRLSVKTRYRPWSGADMVGTAELTHEGRRITLQRTTKSVSPMKNFIAVETGTANFLRELDGETVGETLTGVSREVFERTAFISRAELRVSQTSELEKRITALVSTGEEDVSYTETDERLRAWQRQLRYNKTGALPQLEEELRQAQQKLDQLESTSEEVAGLRGSMDRLEKQLELLQRDLETHDKLDRRAAARRLEEASKNVRVAEARVAELNAALTRNGRQMTRADVKSIRETAASVTPLRSVARDAERALWKAEKALADASAKCAASPLAGKAEEDVSQDIAKARLLEEKLNRTKERKVPRWIPSLIVCLAALALVAFSGLLVPFSQWVPVIAPYVQRNWWGILAAALVLALGVGLFFFKSPRRRADAEALAELLAPYGAASSEKLSSMLVSYTAVLREEKEKLALRDSARENYESASNAAAEAGRDAVEQLSAFMPEVRSGEAVLEALDETERLIDKLTQAEFDMISSKNIYETLLLDSDGTELEVDDSYLPTPLRNRADTEAAIVRAQTQLAEVTRSFDVATGAARALGDPAVLRGEVEELRARIAEGTEKYNALGLAVEALSQANTELQTRFSPLVSRRAGELFARLTDGRYEKLLFDKGFNAGARETGDSVSHSVLSLSEGTVDEIYLSLRLAMCDLILAGDDPCPIILDDALSSFDDERCRRALDLLLEMAEARQILLFTCHSREARMLSERENVNIIRL